MPGLQLVDSELLDALRSGDACALETVFEAYAGMIFRVALRFTRSHEDAQDVLQDVFVALPENVGRLESAEVFDSWLKRVAVRTAMMKLRSGSRRTRFETGHPSGGEVGDSPAGIIARIELEQAIEQLPEALRVVFVLREIEGFQHLEIAAALDISERASQQRMHRARARLRLLLSR